MPSSLEWTVTRTKLGNSSTTAHVDEPGARRKLEAELATDPAEGDYLTLCDPDERAVEEWRGTDGAWERTT